MSSISGPSLFENSIMHFWSSGAILLVFSAFHAAANTEPFRLEWNTKIYFGPDGPWQAVQLAVGSNNLSASYNGNVNLYPGGIWDSQILTSAFCNGSTTGCAAATAGLYNSTNSQTAVTGAIDLAGHLGQWGSVEAMNLTGGGSLILDTFTVFSPYTIQTAIPNCVFTAIDSTNIRMPDGTYYPTGVGLLSLGAPQYDQTWPIPGGSNITGHMISGWLRENGQTASNSWGLHIGSVSQAQAGSLVFGGFDQSRALGTVGAFDSSGQFGAEMIISLLDVGLSVETGGSPFVTSAAYGLLQIGSNSSAAVKLNPALPYLFLPGTTCATIASNLPVTYLASPGIYVWNTTDPRYQQIISSPSYLQFTFQNSGSGNLTIKVSFQLLNLTLDVPIVSTPQPYFPCKPYNSPDGYYYLGRAFLQAAFVGMNWEQGKFFLAQAPGPDGGASQVMTIQPTDIALGSNPINNFDTSWARKWKPLPSATPSSIPPAQKPTTSAGLSTGAKAGIGVGAGILFFAAIFISLAITMKRRSKKRVQAERVQDNGVVRVEDWKGELPTASNEQIHPVHEMSVPQSIYETGHGLPIELNSSRQSLE